MNSVASMVRRLVVVAVVSLAIGSVLVDYGVGRLRDPRVTCGSHLMKPGDTCTHPDGDGNTITDDYGAMESGNAADGYFGTVFGAVLIAAGGGAVAVALFGRRRLAARIERRRRTAV